MNGLQINRLNKPLYCPRLEKKWNKSEISWFCRERILNKPSVEAYTYFFPWLCVNIHISINELPERSFFYYAI